MPGNRRTNLKRLQDQQQIAELYLQGKTQSDIGQILGIDQGTISRQLTDLRKKWMASGLRDFDALKAEQLVKIDHLEQVAWGQFEASLAETVSRTQYVDASSEGDPMPRRAVLQTKPGFGDDRWLKVVQWCIDARVRLLGLDKLEASNVVQWTPEQWKAQAEERLRKVQEKLGIFSQDDEYAEDAPADE